MPSMMTWKEEVSVVTWTVRRDCHIMAKILSMVMVSSPIQFNYKNFSFLSLTFD